MSSLSSLLKAPDPDPEAVLSAADAVLAKSRGDGLAQQAKAVALLKLDRFADAQQVFQEGGKGVQQAIPLAYAYILYKVGELKAAREVASRLDDRGAKLLEAQVAYRSEDFGHAADLYRQLMADVDTAEEAGDGEASDLRVNAGAAEAQLRWKHPETTPRKPAREDLDAFATAYNAACACLASGEMAQSEVLLKRAADLCVASDLPEEEKKTELLSIKVQQLYAAAVQGKKEAAERLSDEIVAKEIPDEATRQVAQINKLALQNQPANPYLAQRIFQSFSDLPAANKLFNVQEFLVQQNERALELLSFKFNGVANATQRELQQYSTPTTDSTANTLSATNAAAHAQCQLGKLGLKSILPLLDKRPLDIGLALTVVQLYILTKNHGAAIKVMESLLQKLEESKEDGAQDVRFAPGVIAVLISLYSIEGRKSHVRSELAKAATFWRHRSKTHSSFFQATGATLLRSGTQEDTKQAQDIFSALHKENADDPTAIAGFVAAFAVSDPSKVNEPAKNLTSIDKLTGDIDAAALDQAGVPTVKSAAAKIASRKRAAADATKPAKKRARKSRLPKDHDPNKKPDAERWLPLRDRSTYKPKGKKGKQKQAALTQGGISKETADGSEPVKTEVAKASGGGSKAKKKKGKK